jgi:serine/threonine protein kinase
MYILFSFTFVYLIYLLGDYGTSRFFLKGVSDKTKTLSSEIGTLKYMSPELAIGEKKLINIFYF